MRIRVEAAWHESMLAERVMPAKSSQDGAMVQLTIVVGTDGSVLETRPLAGPEEHIALAADAVRQWKYRPTKLNGRPVEVESTVELFVP